MLGRALGLPTGYPCAAGLGSTDFGLEAEVRSTVEGMQSGLALLESKLAKKLEIFCARQVDDAIASPLQQLRQTVSKVEADCQHVRVEFSRVPLAKDVDAALQQHKTAIESRVGDRVEALERSISKQHFSAMEQLESRGGETWRACLQRMSDLESKTVLQAEVPRIIERALADVRKAGPDILGPGAVLGPAALTELRGTVRRIESKVAGCEARILGLSEEANADGRVWRASLTAKVEALEKAQIGLNARVAGCEAEHKASQDTSNQRLEHLEAETVKVRESASKAHDAAKTHSSEALERAERLLEEQARDLRSLTRGHVEELQARLKGMEDITEIHKQDMHILKQATETLTKWRTSVAEDVARVTQDLAQVEARTSAITAASRQASSTGLARVESDLHQLESRFTASSSSLEAVLTQVRSSTVSFEKRLLGTERSNQSLSTMVTRMDATHRALEQLAARFSVTHPQHPHGTASMNDSLVSQAASARSHVVAPPQRALEQL
eukprot:2369680-Amphidinium_carterae.1